MKTAQTARIQIKTMLNCDFTSIWLAKNEIWCPKGISSVDFWNSFCLYCSLLSVTLPQNYHPPHPLSPSLCFPSSVRQPAIPCDDFPFCTVGNSEHASSRMLAGTVIGLILIFPFSQASQSGAACCLTPENSY